ncbi:cell division protein ZapA [Diaphorobacter sp. HDW4A]|uniref:cell division protein ZapA n=1 Tax=Diaphorobacter sp. HDW4A TaxID=2714924 RepID=UPI00140E8069|nr:cell division protein ZapA [Diaphorobacter sp. HDW4A]QIL79084.1 cell division protein ZapA [Diaphorobacter sp. HDW4A]
MKQIEVKIMQQSYLLSCPEDQETRMLSAVERVDAAMTRIRDAGKVRARERIAVLAALNMAFEIADHETAALAAKEQTDALLAAVATAAPAATHTTPTLSEDDEARVRGLLQRLDETLGDDGRLL